MVGLLAVTLLLPGCSKPDWQKEVEKLDYETRLQRKYVNTFAYNVLDSY